MAWIRKDNPPRMGCGKESAALDAVGSRTVSGLLKAKGTMFRKNLGETMGCNEIYGDLIVIQWDVFMVI